MTEAPTQVRLPGRHTIHVGDTVRVAGAYLETVAFAERGWSGAKLLRLLESPRGLLAEVTVPGRAATRTIPVERLTRQRSQHRA